MTTTLFTIFGIALVATLAWVITRIVNIFVELEELLNKNVTTLQDTIEILVAGLDEARTPQKTDAQKEKSDRVAKYIVLRNEGLSIRKAGEEVGVAYSTAKRYEKIRKE